MRRNLTQATIMSGLTIALVLATSCGLFQAAPSECIEAAEEAGLPDRLIEQLEDPDGLNPLERAALQRALKEAGIDDACESTTGVMRPEAQHPRERAEIATTAVPAAQATPEAEPTREEEPTPKSEPATGEAETREPATENEAYAQCLDQLFLQNAGFPMAIWHCRHLETDPTETTNPTRCRLTTVQATQARYPEWPNEIHDWHAISQCIPTPSEDALSWTLRIFRKVKGRGKLV